jgi:hypothetical protein
VSNDTLPKWADKFTKLYIDSGDLIKALEGVKVSLSEFYEARSESPRFAEHMKAVTRRANETLRLKALGLALSGSDKLLGLALKTLEDEDADLLSKLSDEQLTRKILNLIARVRARQDALSNGPNDSPTNGVT